MALPDTRARILNQSAERIDAINRRGKLLTIASLFSNSANEIAMASEQLVVVVLVGLVHCVANVLERHDVAANALNAFQATHTQ